MNKDINLVIWFRKKKKLVLLGKAETYGKE